MDTGKSTLADWLGQDFVHRYKSKGGRRLYLDSKPRVRAEWTVSGRSAASRYKGWDHGQPIPGSVVVDDPADLPLAWKTGARTVIMQGDSSTDVPRLVAGARAFLQSSRADRPQLLHVDETMDFFHANGAPRGGDDAIIRAPRAGRERGTACLFGSQRTRGIPPTIMEEMSRLYMLRIDYRDDAKRLPEMGAPVTPDDVPLEPHVFRYWWKGDYRNLHGPYKLSI